MFNRTSLRSGNPQRVPVPSREGLRRAKPGSVHALRSALTAAVTGLLVIAAAGRAEAQVGTGGTTVTGTGGTTGSTAFLAADFFRRFSSRATLPSA